CRRPTDRTKEMDRAKQWPAEDRGGRGVSPFDWWRGLGLRRLLVALAGFLGRHDASPAGKVRVSWATHQLRRSRRVSHLPRGRRDSQAIRGGTRLIHTISGWSKEPAAPASLLNTEVDVEEMTDHEPSLALRDEWERLLRRVSKMLPYGAVALSSEDA